MAGGLVGVDERAATAKELADRVAALSSTASGVKGTVTVTVDGSGQVSDLRLAAAAGRMPPDELAREILATMRRAQAGLAALATQAVAETVGADTDTGRAVIAGFARRYPEQPRQHPEQPRPHATQAPQT